MAVAIKVVPDRFQSASEGNFTNASDGLTVRRMTRGTWLKQDTFATLRLVAGTGDNKLVVDAGSRRNDANAQPLQIGTMRATDIYSNFLLQQISEERQEKSQILETFGEPYIFLFGERARLVSFQGILANTWDFNWEAEWWYNYDNYLRGTQAVQNDARVFLSYDNTIIGGYIISANATKVATERNWVNFSFQMFITSYTNFSQIGNPYALPGTTVAVNDSFDNQSNVSLTNSQAAAFRPNLLPSTISTRAGIAAANNPLSLAEGIVSSGIAAVNSAFNAVSSTVNGVLRSLSNLISGSTVRVPVGFAGTMAYDSTMASENKDPRLVSNYGPVTYSVFGDNDDEFVGASSQYGSSNVGLGGILTPDDTLATRLAYGQAMVTAASAQWAKAGYPIPASQLGPVSTFIVGKALGLGLVGATAAWQKASSSSSQTNIPYPMNASTGGAFAHAAVPIGG